MKRAGPPQSKNPLATLEQLRGMGDVVVNNGEHVEVILRTTRSRTSWRRVAGTTWFERIDGGEQR